MNRMRHITAPDVRLSYGTIFKTIDAEMNAAGLRKDFFNLFFITTMKWVREWTLEYIFIPNLISAFNVKDKYSFCHSYSQSILLSPFNYALKLSIIKVCRNVWPIWLDFSLIPHQFFSLLIDSIKIFQYTSIHLVLVLIE